MSATITVGNQAQLLQALSAASGGETIVLEGGNYGNLFLRDSASLDLTFSSTVTLVSADPNNPAIITGIDMVGATNMAFDGITFDYKFKAGDPLHINPFSVTNSTNVQFRNSVFDGALASGVSSTEDGYGYGVGLWVRGSTGVTVKESEFFNFYRGMLFLESGDVSVLNNEIHSIRSDGMDFVEVRNVLIEGNYIHDFKKSPLSADHMDMIQFWTTGTANPSTDITIRNNYLDIGAGNWAQSIFMRNEMVDQGLAGTEMFYRNVLIENNVIVNGHAHGVTVGETAGLIIRNNSILHSDGNAPDGADAAVEIPGILVGASSTGVLITQNLTAFINGYSTQGSWTVTDNGIVQDQNPLAPGYYGDVFIASSLQPVNGVHAFILLPGSALDLANIGASLTQPEAGGGLTMAQFHVNGVVNDGASRVFDARFGLPDGTLYHWDFGDGTSADGPLLMHSFSAGGRYDVVLTVTLPDGQTSAATLTLGIDGPDVLKLASTGGFLAYDYGVPTPLAVPAAGSTEGIQLSATGVAATVATTHVVEVSRSNEIEINLRLKADQIGTAGEVFRLHGTFMAQVNSAGALTFTTYSKTGSPTTVTSTGVNLADGAEHQVWVRIADGKVLLTVDDKPAVQVAFPGPLGWTGAHGLSFGNPWGSANFLGDVTAFGIRTDVTDYPTRPDTVVIDGPTLPPQEGRVLIGGTGDDIYILEYVTDVVQDAGGIDEARSRDLSIDLRSSSLKDIEHAALSGSSNLDLTGDEQDNQLTGNAGDNTLAGRVGSDTLEGRGGADTLKGGLGDDVYVVDAEDTVLENADEGSDTVLSSVSHALAANVETLILTGTRAIDGTGNGMANLLVGNDMANTLEGRGGADTLKGGLGDDVYVIDGSDTVLENADEGSDTVLSSVSHALAANVETLILTGTRAIDGTGNGMANTLVGNDMANTLEGMGGADTLKGGLGDDVYVVDAEDTVLENADEGSDTVFSSVSHALAANVETLILTGTAAIDGTGNAAANLLVGNDMANTLDGRIGPDTMQGGLGNDTYIVRGRDTVIESSASGGKDTVLSYCNFTLSDNVETLILTGTREINGTGNAAANLLVGNDMANTLRGGGGADTMRGGLGDDVYVIDGSDALIENAGEGWDMVSSSVSHTLAVNFEALVLTGSAALTAIGNKQDNLLIGNDAANALHGGEGRDTLTGGGGVDSFVFRSGFGADLVTDFNAAGVNHDILNLQNVKSITSFNDLMTNHVRQVAEGVLIDAGKGDTILLHNVLLADLDRGDFLL